MVPDCEMNTYIVATVKPWNVNAFERYAPSLPGKWLLLTNPEELTARNLQHLKPRYIFFPHWSWIVPSEVVSDFECVCFHMADVPYGRGGSPLQNLVVRGHKETKLTALRMLEELDAGPVYLKQPMSLLGSAQQIFERQAELCYEMIRVIADTEPLPVEQVGESVTFKRRKPSQSELPRSASQEQLYDFVRMLDAETYPPAFLRHGNFHLEFSAAEMSSEGEVVARVRFCNAEDLEK